MDNKIKMESYEWAKYPDNLPRENLVLITAKTTRPTMHPEDPEYPIRIFKIEELREAARSLAQRVVGLNHMAEIQGAFTVDAQWNEQEQAVEALLFLPTPWMNKIRRKEIKKVSVEYTWRDEKRTEKGVEFMGLVFNRVDLLSNISPGDGATQIKLVEGKRGLMEGIIQDNIQASVDNPSLSFFKEAHEAADEFMKTLGEPFAGYTDFADCVAKNQNKRNPSAYCGYIKYQVEDKKKKEGSDIAVVNEDSQLIPMPKDKNKPDGSLDFNVVPKDSIVEIKDKQVPELPVSPMATEPTPLSAIHQEPVSQQQEPGVGVTAIGAMGNDKGPIINESKDVGTPIKGDVINLDGIDKSKQKVESSPEPDKDKKLKPEVVTPIVAEPLPESIIPPVVVPPQASVVVATPVQEPVKPIVEVPKLDAKDVKIVELEGAVNRLQESAKTTEKAKKEAVDKAKKEVKEDLLKKVESVLPDPAIVSNFNRGGQILANDLRKVIYEAKKDD
jgi:hypothetical protein